MVRPSKSYSKIQDLDGIVLNCSIFRIIDKGGLNE